ncbi:hypothetical protein RB213_015503 [Colletotrichum asianum]
MSSYVSLSAMPRFKHNFSRLSTRYARLDLLRDYGIAITLTSTSTDVLDRQDGNTMLDRR